MGDADFRALLGRARAGDDRAMADLLGAFEREVRMIVRARLPQALRSRFDTMDFVQAVWQSVVADGPVAAFDGPGHFRGYLEGVATNKVLAEYRRATRTKKFEIGREEPLYVRRGDREAPRDLPGADPTPSQVAQADECWDRIAAARSPAEAEVVLLRRGGLTFAEIAGKTGLSERTVRRALDAAWRRVAGG